VRRSSLRCFFFDMRLRRFLMTEPMYSATYLPMHCTKLRRDRNLREIRDLTAVSARFRHD
jgi:hypothetical protein